MRTQAFPAARSAAQHVAGKSPARGHLVTIVGFALIAVTYGLIRFSYGQFLPAIRADLGLSESLAGIISSALFLGNCTSLLISAYAAERYGPRIVATLAAVVACAGLTVMAFATDSMMFAVALMFAGSSAGLSFPPFVIALKQTVRPSDQARSASIINVGTCAGIALSGPIALYMLGDWRLAFAGFAVIALVVACATVIIVPGRSNNSSIAKCSERVWTNPNSRPLLLSSLAFGATSAVFWTFGGDILTTLAQWSSDEISVFWIVIGIAGFVGAGTGLYIRRWSLDHLHKSAFVVTAAAILLLSMANQLSVVAYIAGILFGAAYMVQTAIYVIWAMRQMPDHAAILCAAAFFMLPLGQIGGSVALGYMFETFGIDFGMNMMVLFALAACVLIPAHADKQTAQGPSVEDVSVPEATTRLMAPANITAAEAPTEEEPAFARHRTRRPKLFFLHPRAESLSPEFRKALTKI